MRISLGWVVLSLLVGACNSGSQDAKSKEEPTEAERLAAETSKAAEAVRSALKDPDSARFGNVRRIPFMGISKTTWTYCGEVNAKNSFGGFTGFRPFVVVMQDPMKAEIVEDGNLAAELTYMIQCTKDDKPIPGTPVTLGS